MDISKCTVTSSQSSQNLLMLEGTDFPITVKYGETNYVLVLTKSKKLLLQKPLK